MVGWSAVRRVAAPTALVAALGTTTAIAINFATGESPGPMVWPAVVGLTVLSMLASLWLYHRAQQNPAAGSGTADPLVRIGDTRGDVTVSAIGFVQFGLSPGWVVTLVASAALPALLYGLGREVPEAVAVPPPPAAAPAVPIPGPDVRIHEVWASSAENVTHFLDERGDWAMTDFKVTVPYLRSTEMAAGPNGSKVLLSVKDEHDQEIAQGEAIITDYRAKVVFDSAVDVTDYVDRRLHFELKNIYGGRVYVYLTKNDRDRTVTSYLSCPSRPAVSCPNPKAQDLSVLIVGRATSW
jgi:hypothetical protein